MDNEQFEQQMYEEMGELEGEQSEDQEGDRLLTQQEFQEACGYPEQEEKHNQHTFISKSLSFEEPEKVTFMTEFELGRPLFSLRFLLDIEDICKYYLDEIAKGYKIDNKISTYFREKINNYCASGMSNKGFLQNLNVTKKMDTTRQRVKAFPEMKGGRKIRT